MYKTTNYCRLCLSNEIKIGIKFEKIPLPDLYSKKKIKALKSKKYTLSIGWCKKCKNVQTMEIVNPKLENHEKLHNIVVVAEDWTIENNLLTPTMKIKRNAIEKIYKSNYVAWYEGERVAIID